MLTLPPGPVAGIVVGDSLRSLAEAAKLALELVARGRLRAALVRRDDAWAARWLSVTEDPQDAARVELLESSMPVVVSASPDAPEPVACDVLDAVVDACARELLSLSDDGGDPRPQSAVDAWLSALAREDPVVCGDPWELGALAEQLEEWWNAGQRYATKRMFRTCFRLVAPDEDEGHDGSAESTAGDDDRGAALPWRVEILLQSKEDPSVLVPAAEVWAGGERLTALGRMLDNPHERLLGGLGHALTLWPDLEPLPPDTPAPAPADRSFWNAGPELADVRINPLAGEAPEALVRRLGPAPIAAGGLDLADVLAGMYVQLAAAAERRALAE